MIKLALALSLLAAPAAAQFKPFNAKAQEAPAINFCATGKFVIAAGNCEPGTKHKDAVSPKACSDAAELLYDGLGYLYPNAKAEYYQDLTPDEVLEKLNRPLVLGFFFVGEGDPKGGFVTGPERGRLYPNAAACSANAPDLFGGITSHSKYSPEYPAGKADTGKVISRHQLLYGAEGSSPGSWSRLCKPRLSLVYPTRTFAGRVKDDVKKLLAALQDEKKKHVLKTLAAICDNCAGHAAAGGPLARLCPPQSDVCRQRKIQPGTEELILTNYCAALAPTAARAE
ncbi:MAG TPA: hypothetical protein DCQ25_11420 [Elusimicrobia bacterium]|nr:hypothetical protein [Elusimicrobiota bacterium]